MTDRRTIKLANKATRQRAHDLIDRAPDGYTLTIGEETRSQEQNRKLWPMIADAMQQDAVMATMTADQVKLRFLNALGNEMKFLPELEGGGSFLVGQRSSTLTKGDFSMLIELIFAWGAREGIQWSAKTKEMHPDYV